MYSTSVFFEKRRLPEFQGKNADVSITYGVYYMIYTFFGLSLGRV